MTEQMMSTRVVACPFIIFVHYAEQLPVHLLCYFFFFYKIEANQNNCHFPDNISKVIFLTENCCSLIKKSLKFVHEGFIDNMSAMIQIMAWQRTDNKQSSEPMVA